jgi:uncharacterized heparinase superfamily protein
VWDEFVYNLLPEKVARYASTLRHVRPAQVLHRLRERFVRIAHQIHGTRSHQVLQARAAGLLSRPPLDDDLQRWRALAEWKLAHPSANCDVAGGQFTFLNETHELGFPPKWTRPRARDAALWQFQLHYLDWIWLLLAQGKREEAIVAVDDWIARNLLGAPYCFDAPWSAYTISLRLPNMMAAYALLADQFDENRKLHWLYSIAAQGLYLTRHIEWEHGGNHLLENLRCLAMLEQFLACDVAGWHLLQDQLRRQILPGGMHEERSPMYQSILADHLMDLAMVLRESHRDSVLEVVKQMLAAMETLQRPDGRFPLLGDSTWDGAPPLPLLRERCPGTPPVGDECDGHHIYRDEMMWLLFDTAPMGPPSLGAHQHADLLGFELWLDGREIIADGGAGVYRHGRLRSELRAAQEHAVPTIDGKGPADPWKSFRMARPVHPRKVKKHRSENVWTVCAEHSGFGFAALAHRRELTVLKDSGELRVVETFFPVTRLYRRRRIIRCGLHLPLAPGIDAHVKSSNRIVLRDARDETELAEVVVESTFPVHAKTIDGRRWEAFGKPVKRTIVVLQVPFMEQLSVNYVIRSLRVE